MNQVAQERAETGEMARLLELAMQEAVQVRHPGRDLSTVDLHLSFMGTACGPLTASAQVVGGGKTVSFCEAQLNDADGRPVAQAMGTFRTKSA